MRGWATRAAGMRAIRTGLAFAVATTVVGLSRVPAGAASVLFVDNTVACSDSGPGTEAAPYCSIGAGASHANPGTTVAVRKGTYHETVSPPRSGASGRPIIFEAASPSVTISGVSHAFSLSGRSDITISGFTVTGTSDIGIQVQDCNDVAIIGNSVSFSGRPVSGSTHPGIYVKETTDSSVVGNDASENTDAGIYITTGSSGVLVEGNTTEGNARGYTRAAPGIDIRAGGNTVIGNMSFENEDSGIQIYTAGSGNEVVDNLVWGNGDHGIDNLNSPNTKIISNTSYGNTTSGINVEGTSSGATIANNISMDNAVSNSFGQKGNIRVDSNSVSGSSMDHDVSYLSGSGGQLFQWGGKSYSTLVDLNDDTGQEDHGLQADPRFAYPSTGDFHLRSGSPAIDSADSGVSSQPPSDIEGTARVDDPETPNTGVGPRPFDDRGAYEFDPVPGVPPTAVLHLTPSSGTVPVQVTADASASRSDGVQPITSYTFDFGDGAVIGPQAGSSAVHTFVDPGHFTVSVTVADSGGDTASDSTRFTGTQMVEFVTNPGFETDTHGWTNKPQAGVSLTRTADAHSGAYGATLTNPKSRASVCGLVNRPRWVSRSAPGTYTASLWVRAPSAGKALILKLAELHKGTKIDQRTEAVALSSVWRQVTVTYAADEPGHSTISLSARIIRAAPGICFSADDASITLG